MAFPCPQRIQGLERQLSAAEHAVESAHDAAVAQTEAADALARSQTNSARRIGQKLAGMLRRWYARLPEICATVDELTSNAEAAAIAFRRGDTAAVASAIVGGAAGGCGGLRRRGDPWGSRSPSLP